MKGGRTEALAAFCRLRRLQEANEAGYCQCITCGKIVKWNECDGGHFIPRRYRGTELDPDNVWPQCIECNRYSTITRVEFAEKVAEKIGWKKVNSLEARKCDYNSPHYPSLVRQFTSEAEAVKREKGL